MQAWLSARHFQKARNVKGYQGTAFLINVMSRSVGVSSQVPETSSFLFYLLPQLDLQNDETAFRKFKLITEDVQIEKR